MRKRFDIEAKALSILIIGSTAATSVLLTELYLITPLVYAEDESSAWKSSFDLKDCNFVSSGRNTYFILNPGYKLILEDQGSKGTEELQLIITVLNVTKIVNGTETRVVEEREMENGELVEISRNYFAVCGPSNDVYYFGEEVDNYENGEITSHEGAWQASIDDA